MVRIKHRYLLLNILYPDTKPKHSTSTSITTTTTSNNPPSYLQFHHPTPQTLTPQLFLSHLRSQITLLFGDHGLGSTQASLKLIYFSHATSTAILRVPRAAFRIAWAALTYFDELPAGKVGRNNPGGGGGAGGKRCVVRVVRVSGTIRKAEEELIRKARREVVRARLVGEGRKANAGLGLDVGELGGMREDEEMGGIEDEEEDSE